MLTGFVIMPHSAMLKSGPGLYEFLIEAELQQYYSTIKNDLKVCFRFNDSIKLLLLLYHLFKGIVKG